jgi:hypothetical protein
MIIAPLEAVATTQLSAVSSYPKNNAYNAGFAESLAL